MPFPEFTPGRKKILFFSRGNGRGHAIPDLQIARALRDLRSDVELRFVSYATGARTIEEFGEPLIDLGLPETGAFAETTVAAGQLIGWLQPDLVVSHEEFAVLTAAKIFRRKTLFLIDWFEDTSLSIMHTLKFADEVVFIGNPGLFQEPPWVRDRIQYVGPVFRNFEYTRDDKERAREELDIPAQAFVLSVFPGSWSEERAPILELVQETFGLLPYPQKRLIWLAAGDYELLCEAFEGRDDVRVIRQDWSIDRLFAATDVALTKVNRMAVLELAHLGIPSIALSFGLNPLDDKIVEATRGAVLRRATEITSQELKELIEKYAQGRPDPGKDGSRGARLAAERISHHLDREASAEAPASATLND